MRVDLHCDGRRSVTCHILCVFDADSCIVQISDECVPEAVAADVIRKLCFGSNMLEHSSEGYLRNPF